MCAQEAFVALALDTVVWVPAGRPPHKEVPDDPGPDVRFDLCVRAVAGDDRFAVSRLEVDRPGPSYTVDTLRALARDAPEDELIFIAGGDMASSLPTWREPEEVLALARVAVAERGEDVREEVRARTAALAGADRIEFLDMSRIDVSSSEVRRRVRDGEPIRYLVPDAVADRIAAQGLYRGVEAPA